MQSRPSFVAECCMITTEHDPMMYFVACEQMVKNLLLIHCNRIGVRSQ